MRSQPGLSEDPSGSREKVLVVVLQAGWRTIMLGVLLLSALLCGGCRAVVQRGEMNLQSL